MKHAVGIDLGTTYSSIAYLDQHGVPVTIPNAQGESKTPSVVWFDGDEVVVGTEALRNAINEPGRVIQNAKRFMGTGYCWRVNGRVYSAEDIAAFVLRELLKAAEPTLGPVKEAVITVPAQFGELQREATVRAAKKAGLQEVTIINEPVAAALCYVLGEVGLAFAEVANEQRVLVFDLGGGTFDLSLVQYSSEGLAVVASTGDLHLGGVDWSNALLDYVAEMFEHEFGEDPRENRQDFQFLAMEVENAKRSLSVRQHAAVTCRTENFIKTYQIPRYKFEEITASLLERTVEITQKLLDSHGLGWAHVDVVLPTGGATRMPMVLQKLQEISGRTPNRTLSPDQSVAHGAAYYAGMLQSREGFGKARIEPGIARRLKRFRPKVVSARSLGLLVWDSKQGKRVPVYLIPANTRLPAFATRAFGTVKPNQRRIRLQIIESEDGSQSSYVKLGTCVIDKLPPGLPKNSIIDVTISYDEEARVHLSAREIVSGRLAHVSLLRPDGIRPFEPQKRAQPKPASSKQPSASPNAQKSQNQQEPSAAETNLKSEALNDPEQPAPPDNWINEIIEAAPAAEPPQQTQPSPAPSPIDEEVSIKWPEDLEEDVSAEVSANLLKILDELAALDQAEQSAPLCAQCGTPLDHSNRCPVCGWSNK